VRNVAQPGKELKNRTQGLSMSDIPNNVFNQDQLNSFKQDSEENEYQETTNFGF